MEKERNQFESLPQIKGILAGGNVYFSTLSMNYTSKKPALEHCVYFINGAWYAWMEKAKAQAVPAQKFFSHDFNGDGFKYHDSLEEAQKEAEVSIEWYRERVSDGHHVADDGEFFELCYGVVIASAEYTVDDVVTEEHHQKDEFTKYEVGTEILSLHLNNCNSESGAE